MKMRYPSVAAFALLCVTGCDDKISPWSHASAPQAQARAPIVGQWTAPTNPQASTYCSLDAINGAAAARNVTLVGAQPLSLEGWVATGDLKNPRDFTLVLRGQRDVGIQATTSMPRYDVAKALGSNALTYAGFRIEVGAGSIASGTYRISIAHQGNTGLVICATPTTVTIQ